MTEKSNTHDPKCVHRISTNLTDSDLELLDEEFQKTNFTSRSEYIRAIIRGKTPGKKSTIFNVPSINQDVLLQLKGACNNINQLIKHLHTLKLNNQTEEQEFIDGIVSMYGACLNMHSQIKEFSGMIDSSPKNVDAVKYMAQHLLVIDDYLDLFTLDQADELLFKKVDEECKGRHQ